LKRLSAERLGEQNTGYCSRTVLHLLTAVIGTKGEFAAMPKCGRVLGALLTLPAHSSHSGF
jgi:hypothetical protein